jgi:ElaA protein
VDHSLPDIRHERFADLDPVVAYRLWALRSQVLVVEQDCPYLDLDGRDLEPGTWHVWSAGESGDPVGVLRVLDDGDVWRLGRVATAEEVRGRGVAGALLRVSLSLCADRPVVLDAQAHLVHWYAGFGFAVAGPGFVEDGIAHVPMRREADPV